MKLKLFSTLVFLSASIVLGDGWSESGLTSPVKIETVTTKDDNSVIVKFVDLNKFFYFSNKPQMLSLILTAKSTGASVRAWTTASTGYYNTSDLPPGGISSAHYLGAIQVID